MTLPRLLTRALLAGLVGIGIAQYLLYQRATAGVRSLASRLRPAVLVRYDSFVPFLWGGGRAWNLTLEPAGEIKQGLGVPFGYRLSAREMRVHEIEMAEDGLPQMFDLTLLGLSVPLPAPGGAPAPQQPALELPHLSELGLAEVNGDLRLRFERMPDGHWEIAADANAPGFARLAPDFSLVPGPGFLHGEFSDAALLRGGLRFADLGVVARVREWMALRARVSAAGLEPLLLERLDTLAREQAWKLDTASLDALRRFVRTPAEARVQVAPLHEVLLKNLALYAPGDRFALLGLKFSDRAGFEQPPPGQPE
ncbi:MAG TPA: hypothetical protein VM074_04635 [Solimonas sp.]|nr:hypothetical protein [Solimonas sp.]